MKATPLSQETHDYICRLFPADDELLRQLKSDALERGLPPIHIDEDQGRFLQLLIEIHRTKRILELGTLAGYSAILMARALPEDGRLISCELQPRHAEFATGYLQKAGVAHKVDVRIGPALETMKALKGQTFDLIFIDADKGNYPVYLDHSIQLSKPGTLIIADNTLSKGSIAKANPGDLNRQGLRKYNELAASHPRLKSCLLAIGDGLTLSIVQP